jgi:hypothetical protein
MALLSPSLRIPIHQESSASPSQRTTHDAIHHFKLNEALVRLAEVLSGTLVRFRDVRQPMIGTFTTDTDPVLKIEVLRGIYGSVSSDKIVGRAQTIGPVRVIDPISLLAAKCHNLAGD